MKYIEEYLDEVAKDEVVKDYSLKEWLEDNHHIFFLFQNELFQLWTFKKNGVVYWQLNIHSKEDGDFVKEVKTWTSFEEAISDPVFYENSFSEIFNQAKLFY